MTTYQTINAALGALVTKITTQINDATVLVLEGPPGPYEPNDIISVGEQVVQTALPHAVRGDMAAGFAMEEYSVLVIASAYRGDDDAASTRARAFVLADAVDTAIRSDPTISNNVYMAWPESHTVTSDWVKRADSSGRLVEVHIQIRCRALA